MVGFVKAAWIVGRRLVGGRDSGHASASSVERCGWRQEVANRGLVAGFARIKRQPVLQPRKFWVTVTAANMERIPADKIVAAEGAAKSVKTRFVNCLDRNLSQLFRHAEREGEVSNSPPDDLFQFVFCVDDFVTHCLGVNDFAEVYV